jgi:hypothetical protein
VSTGAWRPRGDWLGVRHPRRGFTQLYLKGRLDLTVEHLVLEEPFSGLFSDDLLTLARGRLAEYQV